MEQVGSHQYMRTVSSRRGTCPVHVAYMLPWSWHHTTCCRAYEPFFSRMPQVPRLPYEFEKLKFPRSHGFWTVASFPKRASAVGSSTVPQWRTAAFFIVSSSPFARVATCVSVRILACRTTCAGRRWVVVHQAGQHVGPTACHISLGFLG